MSQIGKRSFKLQRRATMLKF